jgi:16S rRNA (cytosine967-C5)-methyltransferase
MPVDLVRDAAVTVLLRVCERGARLDAALDKTLRQGRVSGRGGRFLTQLVYGTVRHQSLCDHVLRGLVHQPIEDLPVAILLVLRLGVFQSLFCDNVTHPAMVHTSVDLAKRRGHAGTAKLTNAVLRRAPHSLDAVRLPDRDEDLGAYLSVRYSLPEWIIERWRADLGDEDAEAWCRASCEEAPASLRVNPLKVSLEELTERLARQEVLVEHATHIPEELTVRAGTGLARSKLFQQGMYLIQDGASMLPPHLLEPKPGERVLDVGAAPGGKTTHIAQLIQDQGIVIGMDQNPRRIVRICENAERLGLNATHALVGDGASPPFRGGFDAILVDAPCSGLGTLRRHPDLKWRMSPEAVPRLADSQRALLRSAVELCNTNGRIVYSVCTNTREETDAVIAAVVDECPVVVEDGPAWMNQWRTTPGTYRTRPQDDGLDGFFLTRLRKAS